jgi:nucleoside-diphosphate-sugar epimerase
VHAVAGDAATIVGSIAPVYRAAERSGVRRLVYISSASVHGQAPRSGTNEASKLSQRQPLAYNNAKVKAERRLQSLRARGTTEVVVLRPGIVTGPRSGWQTRFALELLSGRAYWLADGCGICNSIYVDNLVHAIRLAATASAADGQAFLVGDAETVTWADLYRPLAGALGIDIGTVPNATTVAPPPSIMDRLLELRARPAVKSKLALLPMRLRRALETLVTAVPLQSASPWSHPKACATAPARAASLEMALLYRCETKLSHARASAVLGYRPIVPFDEGNRRTLEWLAFAGFPVDRAYLSRAASATNG